MNKFTSCSNQKCFGFNFRVSTIYGSNRYSLAISYGYKTTCWSCCVNQDIREKQNAD